MHSGKTVHDANFVRPPVNCKKKTSRRGARRARERHGWVGAQRKWRWFFTLVCERRSLLLFFSAPAKWSSAAAESLHFLNQAQNVLIAARGNSARQTSNSVALAWGSHLFSRESQRLKKRPSRWSSEWDGKMSDENSERKWELWWPEGRTFYKNHQINFLL